MPQVVPAGSNLTTGIVLPVSPSAVSEAPTTVVDSSGLEGRFRYGDLKEAALRGSLWVLYVIEEVPMIYKVAVGGCVRQLEREKVQRRLMPGCSVEG